jgi:hypothetical protein
VTLRIRSWERHQSAVLKKARWTRESRVKAGTADASTLKNPLSIQSVSVACVFDDDFRRFAEIVGGRHAETYLIRVLQYVASGHALDGIVPVSRDKFGTLVLSRQWDIVPPATGAKVYDALLAARLAVPLVDPQDDPQDDPLEDPSRARSRPVPSRPPPSHAGGINGVDLTERRCRAWAQEIRKLSAMKGTKERKYADRIAAEKAGADWPWGVAWTWIVEHDPIRGQDLGERIEEAHHGD